jgi:hypothetical protein
MGQSHESRHSAEDIFHEIKSWPGAIQVGSGRTALVTADPNDANALQRKELCMSETNEQSNERLSAKETAGCAGAMALGGLVIGTLTAGVGVGIALAIIWGLQTALVAATGYEVQATDLS